jgi:hypothetical protein
MKNGYDYDIASRTAEDMVITSSENYRKRYQENSALPSEPSRMFRDQWEGWEMFLGSAYAVTRKFIPANRGLSKFNYEQALGIARALGIKDSAEYRTRHKEHSDLPTTPEKTFFADWTGWADFLDQRPIVKYPDYISAKEAALSLGIVSGEDYQRKYKQDKRLPANPESYYDEWVDWVTFLGHRLYQSYDVAQTVAQRLGIRTYDEYRERYKEDPRLPCEPEIQYPENWKHWKVFLGTDRKVNYILFYTYEDAVDAARKLGIKTFSEYAQLSKDDSRLPQAPQKYYGHKWEGWKFFLGTVYGNLEAAADAAKALGITKVTEYQKHYTKDSKLPSNPSAIYKKSWLGWKQFLAR